MPARRLSTSGSSLPAAAVCDSTVHTSCTPEPVPFLASEEPINPHTDTVTQLSPLSSAAWG